MATKRRPGAPDRFLVGSEAGRIGVAVRRRGGFAFLAAHADFAALDGRIFPRARALVGEVTRHARRMRGRAGPGSGEAGLW